MSSCTFWAPPSPPHRGNSQHFKRKVAGGRCEETPLELPRRAVTSAIDHLDSLPASPCSNHREGKLCYACPLATVVGVLIEVPVMLSVVAIVNRTERWYEGRAAA